jgi:hypothetical protein
MKVYILYIYLLFLQTHSLFSQNRTTNGKVIDLITKKPIAFANISFEYDKSNGIITDIDGLYFLDPLKKIKTITISHVGYQTKTIKINEIKNRTIELEELICQLDEVEIISKENQAKSIIRKVVKNRAINNPENINTFSFTSYNKVVFDILKFSKNDSVKNSLLDKHIFITETVSKRKYLYPKFTEDIIIGTKASGFKNPTFASLATDIQPFSFYNDIIKLYDVNFLNPISKGSFKKYKFKLENEYYNKQDTIYIISFQPKPNKNIDGLKGLLYINSNKYAIQNVDAHPFKKMKVNIKIQQQYRFVDNKHWFPAQLNYEIKTGKDGIGVKSSGKSYISNVKFNQLFNKKDFALESVKFDKNAAKKDTSFWNSYRNKKLNLKEFETYKFIDSLGKKHHFDSKLLMAESLINGKLRFNYIDIDLNNTLVFNRFENVRLGTGLHTNNKVLKNISFGAFFGYGIKDKKWKFGGEIITKIPSEKDISITLKYQNSLREVGVNSLNTNFSFFNTRKLIAFRMDNIKEYSIQSNIKLHKNIDWSFQFNNTKINPRYDYLFNNDNKLINKFTNSEIIINLKYSINEHIINSLNKKISLPTNYPIFNLTYSKGLKNIFNGSFNYNKFEFSMKHSFVTKNLGITSYNLKAGYIDKSLPYSLLFTGEGSLDSNLPIIMKNNFQTSKPYEFLSDNFINFFTSHNFGSLLLNKNRFQPDIILHNNFGYGYLKDEFKHKNISFKIKNKIFSETGIELKNVLKLNYLDIGSIGFGTGIFYRYGFYSFPEIEDNFEFKFVMSFSIK